MARSTFLSALFSRAKASIYGWLDNPWAYRLTQATVAVGVEKAMTREIRSLLERLPPAHRVLDVGCGPKSRLWRAAVQPIGLDRSISYLVDFRRTGQPAVAASSSMLPFASASFDAVWSFALLHHIPDDAARASIEELLRVTRPGGYVVVHDWSLPERAWRRPAAWALLTLDRGGYMRKREQLLALLPGQATGPVSAPSTPCFAAMGCFACSGSRTRATSAASARSVPRSPKAESPGLVFNPGKRGEGYTNFLWVLLMAAAMQLGFAPEIASRVHG